MLLHSPAGLVEAVFDGVANSGESLKVGRVESQKGGGVRSFDDQRVLEVDHVTPSDV